VRLYTFNYLLFYKTKQNKTKQNKTKQNKTKQDKKTVLSYHKMTKSHIYDCGTGFDFLKA
jgi:hypothetical protein